MNGSDRGTGVIVNQIFTNALSEINVIKRRAHIGYVTLSLVRAGFMSAVVSSLWLIVDPLHPFTGFILGGLAFALLASFTSWKKKHQVHAEDFLIHLDMNHPGSQLSPFEASRADDFIVQPDWQPKITREVKRVNAIETRRLSVMASSLAIPILVSLLLWFKAPPSLSLIGEEVRDMLSIFSGGTTLEILNGSLGKVESDKPIVLSTERQVIKLLPQNMVRLKIASTKANTAATPSVELRSLPSESKQKNPAQTFQMNVDYGQDGHASGWILEFTSTEKSELVIPSLSDKPLALLDVQSLPVPEVQLRIAGPSQEQWPDNIPVPFEIDVQSHNPLHRIQLVIKGKSRNKVENVTTVVGDATKSVHTEYKLNLEPYMEEDIVEFEVTAQAIDHAQPEPLTGTSTPILIKAASAYGRYRMTLQTLGKLKSLLDASVGEAKGKLDREAMELAATAAAQSETSPFFDMVDRVELARIVSGLNEAKQLDPKTMVSKLLDLNGSLASFLFEHEALDDRERDRDFFIAVRTYSRVLEKPAAERPVTAASVVERIRKFLDQRHERWVKRVERLDSGMKPHLWPKIRDEKPFHAGIREALADDQKGLASPAQATLARITNLYKSWIEELEAKEDDAKQRKEQDRQQGLANARNELREIQQRQDLVSAALDRSSERKEDDLSSQWQSNRGQELTNSKQSSALLMQLRALSPTAGERLEAAIAEMDQTTALANKGDFVNAESAADLAGRLLRDAEQSAARSQQKRDRGRRKRTSGDDYHGNAVVGGDVEIKSEYNVDPRYREEILKDIQSTGDDAADRTLLDNYLRQILR